MHFQVIIEVENETECDAFEDWLKKYQNEVVGISENYGCGCCVHIFTIETTENAELLAIFDPADLDQLVELHSGLKKNRIINDYLNPC